MLTQIENASFEELKHKRAEFVALATEQPLAEVARRYVQARTDAKLANQRMGEQSQELAALTSNLAVQAEVIGHLQNDVAARDELLAAAKAELTTVQAELQQQKQAASQLAGELSEANLRARAAESKLAKFLALAGE